MAHDTIYKQPELDAFGTRALEAIKTPMGRIARRYLLPAGYEFAKVAADFERLLKGEELVKGQALETIVDAADNNERVDALDKFIDSVLPLYDDIAPEMQDILSAMREAAARARETEAKPIESPYGTLPAKTEGRCVAAAKLIETVRYAAPEAVFDTLLDLYADTTDEEGRKSLVEAAGRLAPHNFHVWRRSGINIQTLVVDRVKSLADLDRRLTLPLLTKVLEAVLGAELTGTSSTSTTVTFHRGSVLASAELTATRRDATAQLKVLYSLSDRDDERIAVLDAMRSATRPPTGSDTDPSWSRRYSRVPYSATASVPPQPRRTSPKRDQSDVSR